MGDAQVGVAVQGVAVHMLEEYEVEFSVKSSADVGYLLRAAADYILSLGKEAEVIGIELEGRPTMAPDLANVTGRVLKLYMRRTTQKQEGATGVDA